MEQVEKSLCSHTSPKIFKKLELLTIFLFSHGIDLGGINVNSFKFLFNFSHILFPESGIFFLKI